MNEAKRLNPKLISLIVIVVIAALSTGVYAATQNSKSSTATADQTAASSSSAAPSASSAATGSSYKDGTYNEVGRYITPGGGETISVALTLANNIITEVSATGSATRGDSSEYQAAFLSGYKQYVVGKSIDGLSLSRVAGSSLTSNGFNQALEQIKNDASAS